MKTKININIVPPIKIIAPKSCTLHKESIAVFYQHTMVSEMNLMMLSILSPLGSGSIAGGLSLIISQV